MRSRRGKLWAAMAGMLWTCAGTGSVGTWVVRAADAPAARSDAGAAPRPSAPAATRPAVSDRPFVAVEQIPSKSATQAAAADERFVYAVASDHVAKIDRGTGKEIARSVGPAQHLNSAFVFDGKIYCAHSNYPRKPEQGDIRVLDPSTMELRVFHAFENPPGSLTWAVRRGDEWWCHFAHYGAGNGKSVLVRFALDWRETGRWGYPAALAKEWGQYSASGGIWVGDDLLVTGHDKKRVYRIRVPKEAGTAEKPAEVEWMGTIPSPFPGQGIATDPVTGGLVGVDRAGGKVVSARRDTGGKSE